MGVADSKEVGIHVDDDRFCPITVEYRAEQGQLDAGHPGGWRTRIPDAVPGLRFTNRHSPNPDGRTRNLRHLLVCARIDLRDESQLIRGGYDRPPEPRKLHRF